MTLVLVAYLPAHDTSTHCDTTIRYFNAIDLCKLHEYLSFRCTLLATYLLVAFASRRQGLIKY